MIGGWLITEAFKFIGRFITGGGLDTILGTIDEKMDDGVAKEQVKADVTKKWIDAQAALLVGRTWWFQLFFVIPAGIYWAAMIGAQFPFTGWVVHQLPGSADEVFLAIISALFLVDGGKALISRFTK
jgi:hypothetical protein